mgnify:CR=1 FL=1
MDRGIQGFQLPQDEGGFDLTPMIDVVFLLIVFFMTVASMLTAEKVRMNLAVAEESAIPKEIKDRFTFSITENGRFYAGAQEVTLETLGDKLSKLVAIHQQFKVVIRVDRQTEHQHVNKLLELCARNGITDIIFATYQSDL